MTLAAPLRAEIASPSFFATMPALADCLEKSASIWSVERLALGPSSQETFNFSRACLADQKLLATTAQPSGFFSMAEKPGTLFASVAPTDLTLQRNMEGRRARVVT